MSNTKNTTESPRLQEKYSTRHAVLNYFLVLMFTVFPLFASDAFFNIRHDKYYFFLALSGVVIIAEAVLIYFAYCDIKKDSSPEMTVSKVNITKFTFTDWAMLAFLAVCLISAVFSKHTEDALFGSLTGRNNGLILIAFYVGIYFVITRCYYYMEYVFVALAAGSAVVYLLSVLNFCYIDPLGMYTRLDAKTIEDFTSTIGNKNLMSSFICVMLPVVITMSVHTKKTMFRIIYLVSSALGFMALMTADSDSGILGIGVFLVVMLIWYSRKISRLKRYFLCLTVMLASAKILRFFTIFLSQSFGCRTKEIDEFQKLFVESNTGFILIGIAAVITGALYIIDIKKPNLTLSKAFPIVLGSLFAAAVIAILSAVVYFSVVDTETKLDGFLSILRFDESWGTHRGFMWIKSFDIFGDASFFQKLFGAGPDTFHYAFSPYFTELMKYGDSSTNAAHNEYLNYLITIGAFGLIAYLSVVGGTIAGAIKKSFSNPLSIVCVSAVICYSVQAVVNIAQPITTPLFILFVALTEAVSRSNTGHNELV